MLLGLGTLPMLREFRLFTGGSLIRGWGPRTYSDPWHKIICGLVAFFQHSRVQCIPSRWQPSALTTQVLKQNDKAKFCVLFFVFPLKCSVESWYWPDFISDLEEWGWELRETCVMCFLFFLWRAFFLLSAVAEGRLALMCSIEMRGHPGRKQ